jgi:glutamine synthetase
MSLSTPTTVTEPYPLTHITPPPIAAPDPGEASRFLAQHVDTQVVDLLIFDMCGVARGKRVPLDHLAKVYAGGVAFPGSVYGTDITGDPIAATKLVWEEGDADRLCWPIPGSLVNCPWLRRPTAQLMLHMQESDGTAFEVAPREILRRMVALLAAMDLYPVMALELEFYIMDSKWQADGMPVPPTSPTNGWQAAATAAQVYSIDDLDDFDELFAEIRSGCQAQGIPAETTTAESAPGQFEINLQHERDPMAAADHAVMFKRVVNGCAAKHRFDSTFMAKPYAQHAGSGLHIHVSLVNGNGENVFADDDLAGTPLLRHAIGGLRATMAESTALLAPNANSYRRYQTKSYAPDRALWGINNRTCALRVPGGVPTARRVEHRVAGADANPYLAAACVLAGIHHGLNHKLDPGLPVTGNAYEMTHEPKLPYSWAQALDTFEDGPVLRHYFGQRFTEVFLAIKWAERDKFNAYVTPVEYDWYFRNS